MSKLRDALIAYKRHKVEAQVADVAESAHWSKSSSSILRGLEVVRGGRAKVYARIFCTLDSLFGCRTFSVENVNFKKNDTSIFELTKLNLEKLIAEQEQQFKYHLFYLPSVKISVRHQGLCELLGQFNSIFNSVTIKKIINLRHLLTIKNLSISA